MEKRKKGFCGIGIWHPKFDCNIGTLFRSAYAFDVDFTFTIGKKYRHQGSDTAKSLKHLPCYNYSTYEQFKENIPLNSRIVCVEITDKAYDLNKFTHPEQAIYLLGSEGGNLPKDLLDNHYVVKINTSICLNVSVAGSIVLYDRAIKRS